MKTIRLDPYIPQVLLRDLVGHDRSPASFLVYLHLWCETRVRPGAVVQTSLQEMAESIGLSKSAVQTGVRRLVGRKLLRVQKDSATAVPRYRVLTPWVR